MRSMGVRPALIKWFASYLKERSHFTQFGKETSDFEKDTRGVPQGSKLGPVAFVIKINLLPSVIEQMFIIIFLEQKLGTCSRKLSQ